MLRLEMYDTRNPAAWTFKDKLRFDTPGLERAVLSLMWHGPPVNSSHTKLFPAIQPGVFRVNGVPVGRAGEFNYNWGRAVDKNGWGVVYGKPLRIWPAPNEPARADGQSTTAFDMTNAVAVAAWVRMLVEHFRWAAGLHLDYYTDLAWLYPDAAYPGMKSYWTAWNAGWEFAVNLLRSERPDWILQGQQYHTTPITSFVDGLFVEEHPLRSGGTFTEKALDMLKHGRPAEWIFEVRYPNDPQFTSAAGKDYLAQSIQFIKDPALFLPVDLSEKEADAMRAPLLSWGFGKDALIGLPA